MTFLGNKPGVLRSPKNIYSISEDKGGNAGVEVGDDDDDDDSDDDMPTLVRHESESDLSSSDDDDDGDREDRCAFRMTTRSRSTNNRGTGFRRVSQAATNIAQHRRSARLTRQATSTGRTTRNSRLGRDSDDVEVGVNPKTSRTIRNLQGSYNPEAS